MTAAFCPFSGWTFRTKRSFFVLYRPVFWRREGIFAAGRNANLND